MFDEFVFCFKQKTAYEMRISDWSSDVCSSDLNQFQELGHTLFKRSQVLGLISQNKFTIAVAGTHGKTTTTALIAHILTDSGLGCSAFLGGLSTNYATNVLFSDNDIMVVEADEFDRSFLTLYPDIAVVTSADADHLDIYGDQSRLHESFRLFLGQLHEQGKRIIKAGLPFEADIQYSAATTADVYADNIRVKRGEFYFDFVYRSEEHTYELQSLMRISYAVSCLKKK